MVRWFLQLQNCNHSSAIGKRLINMCSHMAVSADRDLHLSFITTTHTHTNALQQQAFKAKTPLIKVIGHGLFDLSNTGSSNHVKSDKSKNPKLTKC